MEVLDAMRYRDYLLKLKLFDKYKKQRNKVIYMIRNSKKNNFLADILTSRNTPSLLTTLTGSWSANNPIIKELTELTHHADRILVSK